MPNPIKRRRSLRNFWINPEFQSRYIFWISASGLALVALNAAVFYFYTQENYAMLVDLSPMTDEAKALLYSELREIVTKLVLASAAFLGATAAIGVVISHRAAGPMFHFKRVFAEIRNGNRAARVNLRPKDDFQDVAIEFNRMMDSVVETKAPKA